MTQNEKLTMYSMYIRKNKIDVQPSICDRLYLDSCEIKIIARKWKDQKYNNITITCLAFLLAQSWHNHQAVSLTAVRLQSVSWL